MSTNLPLQSVTAALGAAFDPHPSPIFSRFLRVLALAGAFGWANVQASTLTIGQTFHQNWVKIAQNNEVFNYPDNSSTNGMGFPRAYLIPTESGGAIVKKAFVYWNAGSDHISLTPNLGWAGSTDGGFTWNSPAPTLPSTTSPDLTILFKRNTSGTLVAIPFYLNEDQTPTTSFPFVYHTSTNKGVSWQTNAGVIDFAPQTMGGGFAFRFNRGVTQDPDGTLWATAYATFVYGENHRTVLMKSTNGGANWKYINVIQYSAKPASDYNEAALVRCLNGSLLAVLRQNNNPLRYRRSTDNGATWGAAAALLPGLPTNEGVDPTLQLMPNGMLVLAYGHQYYYGPASPRIDWKNTRDCHLAFSVDGNGTNWSNNIKTFDAPTPPPTGMVGWQQNSTGYTSITPVKAHRLMQFSDRGEKTYYYDKTNPAQVSPNPFSIWTKVVDIEPNLKNRIDLKGLYAAVGSSLISTDLNYSNANLPEARPTGAFDSSTDYWAGAFKTGTSGTYTIDLQEIRMLNAIGVCLQYNTAQAATIALSTNGTTWVTKKTYAGTPSDGTHRALDYTSFTAAPARYVRVTVSGTTPTGRVGLNEIELYGTTDTFENNAQYLLPTGSGYTAPNGGFVVTEGLPPSVYGYRSDRTLYMNDANSGMSVATSVTKTLLPAATSRTLEFWVKPLGYAPASGAIQFHLTSGASSVYHLAIWSDGSVNCYTTGWSQIGAAGAGTIPLNTWTRIRVVASTTGSPATATVYVNGLSIGTAAKKTGTSIDGFLFGSGGGTPVGDQAFFDDVSFN